MLMGCLWSPDGYSCSCPRCLPWSLRFEEAKDSDSEAVDLSGSEVPGVVVVDGSAGSGAVAMLAALLVDG